MFCAFYECSDAKGMAGVTQPFPDIFDPADLLARAASSPRPVRELRRWRESEITHGRVAMLAALGFVVQEQLEDYPLLFNVDGHITGEFCNAATLKVCDVCYY